MLTRSKKTFFVLLIVLVSTMLIEVGLQTIYYFYHGRTTWSAPEIFNYSEFTYLTNDERFVTIKPDYVTQKTKGWSIATDEYGFRIGKQKPSKVSNIVFLGDSIPFGYGVNSEDSVPGILHTILLNKGVDVGIINAAVPAYSLDQAIQRYRYEIVNKFPSNVIILQTYDPVNQFVLMGREWNVSINWTTSPRLSFKPDSCDYSSTCYLLRRYFSEKKDSITDRLDKNDKTAFSNFKSSIKASLDALNSAKADAEQIILLSLSVPQKSWSKMTKESQMAINAFNSALEEYALSKDNILYIDTVSVFSKYSDEKIFIDKCCHLSSFGAELQAKLIVDALFKNKLKILQ